MKMSCCFPFWRRFISTGPVSTSCLFPVLIIAVTFRVHYTGAQELENCSSARDCIVNSTSWPCCAGVCVKRARCLERVCNNVFDCSDDEVCCSNVCQLESNPCFAISCSFDADCYTDQICCFGTCSYYCLNIINVILISAVAFFLFVFAYCFACRKVLSINRYGYNVDNDRTAITPLSREISFSTSSQENSPSPTKGLTWSYRHKSPWYPTLVSLFPPRGVGSHPCRYAERKEAESRMGHTIISSYGATGSTYSS